jgi:polysaccharide biosynthesis protein PslH
LYFKGCDVFLNPVIEGGGIKTKLVEALGNGMNVVTTTDGAIGVDESICRNKLTICQNNDWSYFAKAVLSAADLPFTETPIEFYNHFYWGKIAEKANNCLLKL